MGYRNRTLMLPVVLLIGLLAAHAAPAQQRGGDHGAERPAQREAPMQRDQQMQHQRERAQDPIRHAGDREPLHVQDRERVRDRDIYGSALMTRTERRQYRDRLHELQDEREWARFRAEHQREIQRRATERGVELPRPFFGQQLMTDAERVQLHERLRAADDREREQIHAEHRERMMERARALRVPESELAEG
jgi:hypothetical protein